MARPGGRGEITQPPMNGTGAAPCVDSTAEQFIRSMEGRRAPFGQVLSRSFIGAAFTRKLTVRPMADTKASFFGLRSNTKARRRTRDPELRIRARWRVVDYRLY